MTNFKIVKNITSKGFIRSNYEEKLVDLSDVRINLKAKHNYFLIFLNLIPLTVYLKFQRVHPLKILSIGRKQSNLSYIF